MTSPDGITWTIRTSAADNSWRSVTYGNGLFVAVSSDGTGNRVMTSPDGITWTLGATDNIMTSPDGINWTRRQTNIYNAWRSVTYGNGVFVAVSSDGTSNQVIRSTDNGVTWASSTNPSTQSWYSVTYGNGLFVAVATTGGVSNSVMTSPDGITWTTRTSISASGWYSVTYGNGLFVAVGNPGSNLAMTSLNGITWATTTTAASNQWKSVAYGNGIFTAVSSTGTGNRVMTSNSGTFYNNSEFYKGVDKVEITNDAGSTVYGSVSSPTSDQLSIPLTTNALSVSTTTTQYRVRITPKSHANMPSASLGTNYPIKAKVTSITSSTGVVEGEDAIGATTTVDNLVKTITFPTLTGTWINGSTGGSYYDNSITFCNGTFITLDGVGVNKSYDGITWTPYATTTLSWSSVKCINNQFVGISSTQIGFSSDGISWSVNTFALQSYLHSLAYGNGIYVAVGCGTYCGDGATENVLTSYDGVTWTARTGAADNNWTSVTYGNGLFVAVAQTGTGNRVMTSPDGVTWTSRASAADYIWESVIYGNGIFVASGFNVANVMTSPDGISWTLRTIPASFGFASVTYTGSLFVAVQYDPNEDSVFYSFDGINWSTYSTTYDYWTYVTSGNGVMIALAADNNTTIRLPLYTKSPANNSVSLSFVTPPDNDLSSILVLQSTNQIGDTPVDGITYATSSRLGNSDVTCSFAVATSTTYTCNTSYNNTFNGTPYYFKLFTRDNYGNYSEQILTASTTPNRAIILDDGIDPESSTLAPGSSATTSDSFTLSTQYGNDRIQSLEVTFAEDTATSTSLVEITDSTGTFVYGSTSTPATDVVTIPVTNLVATEATTTYKIRITPKSATQMPDPSVGTSYALTTYISNWTGTNIANKLGSDTASTIITIDNQSPENTDQLGVKWRTRASAADNQWAALTYASSTFVAVSQSGTGNRVMTSSDGITWTSRTSAVDNTWTSVTYGNGTFVAVSTDDNGAGNRVMTSPDGITWTARIAAASNNWRSVTYGNGLFVAVSDSYSGSATNRVITSPDGVTWTKRTAIDDHWYSVTYGNGTFVAVSLFGGVMTSTNGTTWVSRTSAANNSWRSVTYGNGLFVAVAESCASVTNCVMTSPDGITWTARRSASTNGWTSVVFGNGLFVAVSQYGAGNNVMTSPDGITWTSRTNAGSDYWLSVAYGNNSFTAVGFNCTGNCVMTSNGPTLTSTSTATTITFTNPDDLDISTTTILRSTSPITDTPTEGVSYATSSTIGASTVVCSFAVTASSTRTCTATGLTNGTPYYFKIFVQDTTGNWSTGVALDPVAPGSKIVTLGSGIDLVGGNLKPGATATTSDTFTLQTDSGTDVINSIVVTLATTTSQALSLIEITNDAGAVVYGSAVNPSSDIVSITLSTNTLTATSGITQYKVRITPKSHVNMPAVPGAAYYVTTYISNFTGSSATFTGNDNGATTTIIVIDNESPSTIDQLAVNWRNRTFTPANSYRSVTYGNGLFVTVDSDGCGDGCLATSPDGITWTARTAAADNAWAAVTYATSTFVAVAESGSGNRVMTSSNGTSWTSRSSAANNNWISVTYGNGLFVAVSDSQSGTIADRVMTSPDGINWTARTAAANNNWISVTYGNGLFVAVSDSQSGTIADRVMTSPDGINWTARTAAANNNWTSVTFGNGLFVAVAWNGSGSRVMTSSDGLTWTSRTEAANENWNSVGYGGGVFVAIGNSNLMTSLDGINWTLVSTGINSGPLSSSFYANGTFVIVGYNSVVLQSTGPIVIATSTVITVTFVNPPSSDISTTTILRSTSPITDTPVEGVSYATSSTIGASTAVCSFAVTASSTRTCTASSLTNGTPYYFKIFTQDTSGNWSIGVALDPIAPGSKIVTLGVGSSTPSVSLVPGGTATTSDTFTLQTDSGTDVISSITVTLATTTAQALSLIEITNDTGSTVYGSVANPSSDIVVITLSTNTLTANTSQTQYRVRVTPKSHVNMPSVPGSTYYVTSYVSSLVGTLATMVGTDQGAVSATMVMIDNESPLGAVSGTGEVSVSKQIKLYFTNSSSLDATSTVVFRSVLPVVDTPVEGVTYSVGNVIGASTVTCVADNIILSNPTTCTDQTAARSKNYYYKIFTRDNTGNYSLGLVPSGLPFRIKTEAAGIFFETEVQNGGTTTIMGGGDGGGGGDTSTTTNGTTTNTGGGQGGGGGDVGFFFKGSNLASFFRKSLNFFFTQSITGGTPTAYAESAVPIAPVSLCSVKVFGVCIIRNLPGITQ
jgi:hypothetical protein